MAVTMTAELADCFDTKREGVAFVLDAFRTAFPEIRPWVYGIDGRFRSADAARRRPLLVAAANWRASATLVARAFPDALFLDVGSTTTDVIPIVCRPRGRPWKDGSRPAPHRRARLHGGAADAGVRDRALGSPRGRRCRVAAEHFAIAADVHRWLERIDDGDYTCETPDGRGPEPRRGRRAARANGVRRSRDARRGRYHGHRGARGAGTGAADRRRHPAGDAAPRLGLLRASRFSPDRERSWRGRPRRRSAWRPATWPKTSDSAAARAAPAAAVALCWQRGRKQENRVIG